MRKKVNISVKITTFPTADMHFIPGDELFDEEIGDFIEECLSTSDSDDTPVDTYVLPRVHISNHLQELEPAPTPSNAIVPPSSIWSLCDSFRAGYPSGEESITGEKKVERR